MVVKCIGLDKGKVRLSRKAALEQSEEANDGAGASDSENEA